MAKKIGWWTEKAGLSEIYQQTGIHFAFLSSPKDGYKQCHPWVKCRDFLHDGLRSSIAGTKCSIYGYNYDSKKNPPIDVKRTRMLVKKPGVKESNKVAFADFDAKMKAAKKLINHYEEMAGVPTRTRISKSIDNKKDMVWLFQGPSFWTKSPYLISMYTFLIRLGDKKIKFKTDEDLLKALKAQTKVKKPDNDQNYLNSSHDKLHIVIQNWEKLFKGVEMFDPKIPINSYHNKAGIRSLCQFGSAHKELNVKLKEMFGGKK